MISRLVYIVNSATDFIGGSGGDLVFDGMVGEGVSLTWFGQTAMGYGVIHDGESASMEVNVTLDSDLMSDLLFDYQINGDEYGSEPHIVNGQIMIDGQGDPADWISLDPVSGEIIAGNYDIINYQIDSASLTEGVYTCDILITGNAVADHLIPVTLIVSGTSAEDNLPAAITQLSNYPNPFNPETTISFFLNTELTRLRSDSQDFAGQAENTELVIYNLKGQKVKDLTDSLTPQPTNPYSVTWNGTDDNGNSVPSGIYYYRLKTGSASLTKKMLLLK